MPRPQRLHRHSLATYAEERPKLGARLSEILAVFRRDGRLTDRAVMRRLAYHDPNMVRPRITDAIKAGLLEEVGEERDQLTGRTVRVCAIVTNTPEQLALFQAQGG